MANPSNKKPRSQRSKHDRGPKERDLRAFVDVEPPPPPPGLRPAIVAWWAAYFESDVAKVAFRPSDLPALSRLAQLYELREMAYEEGMKEPIVRGGNNQPTENPMLRAVSRYDSAIDRLEDRFGLSPRARANLGIQIGQATRTLDDLAFASTRPAEVEGTDPRDAIDV